MKKIVLLFLLLGGSLAFGQEDPIPQEDTIPQNIYGIWKSEEGEFLRIQYGEIFERRDLDGRILAAGKFKFINGEMHIERYDKEDEYNLVFFINYTTMVISKPRSNKAWLWHKLEY